MERKMKQLHVGDLIQMQRSKSKPVVMFIVTEKVEHQKDLFYGYDATSLDGKTISFTQDNKGFYEEMNCYKIKVKNLTRA